MKNPCGLAVGLMGAFMSFFAVHVAVLYANAPNSFWTYYIVGLIVFLLCTIYTHVKIDILFAQKEDVLRCMG
jgi:hypothetical protein